MGIKKSYCSICERHFYTDYWTHILTHEHKSKKLRKRDLRKAEENKQQKENDFACQLASALEGYTLNPGDEVSLRDGRSFKVDIRGTLFEIPIGS